VRALILVLLTAGLALLLYRFSAPDPAPSIDAAGWLRTDEDARLEGLRYFEWQGTSLAWVMNAETAGFRFTPEQADLHGVKVVYFQAAGERIHLQANEVSYDNRAKLLVAEGDVKAESDQGYCLETGSVTYSSDKRELHTEDKVRFHKDRLLIEGQGMDGSLTERRFVMRSGVKAIFSPPFRSP